MISSELYYSLLQTLPEDSAGRCGNVPCTGAGTHVLATKDGTIQLCESCAWEHSHREGIPRKQRGQVLLEMLVAVAIMGTLFTLAIPSVVQVINIRQATTARQRVLWTWQAMGSFQTCQTLTPSACGGLAAQLPPANTPVIADAYTYLFVPSGTAWTYTATPTRSGLPTLSINSAGQTGGF